MMFKYAALVSLLVVMGESQRPPYAGTANRYPLVLPRFAEEEAAAAAAAAATGSGVAGTQGTNAGIGNRVGEESGSSSISPVAAGAQTPVRPIDDVAAATISTSTASTTTSELPILALGQSDFVDRIKTWPEDQRPFWYTNRDQINAHLHPANQPTAIRPNVEARSFFAGRK